MTTSNANTVVPSPVVPVHGEKPEKFNGVDFKRWQQKMFYLTTLNLTKFLYEDAPALKENESNRQVVATVEAWKHADFLCKNYILNGLDNALYNVYSPIKSAKELWDSLDKKYKAKDAGMKKYIVGRFLEYKMVDSKSVMSQVQELQLILHDIHAEDGLSISDAFQVAAIIEKLPPSWKDFRNYLKHKRKEMNLEDLIVRLRIEEDNHGSERKLQNQTIKSRANVVEQKFDKKKRKQYSQRPFMGPKGSISKKFKERCFVCDKSGYRAKDCRKQND